MNQDSSAISTETESSNHSVSLVLTACAISVFVIFLVYKENFVFGSEAGNWVYRYFKTVPTLPRWIPVITLLSLSLFVFIGSKLIHSYEKIVLFGSFLNAVLIQFLICSVYRVSLGSIVRSDLANSFYTPAIKFSTIDILTKYHILAPSFPLHAKSNMPGKILLYEFFTLFTFSPEIMGYFVIIVSSLGALLIYGVCKKLFHDKQAAFYALVLYALLPAKLFFLPLLNTVTPVFMLLCFYLFVLYIEKKNVWIVWLLGVALYVLILFEPSPLITIIVLVGILIYAIKEKSFSKKDFWRLFLNLVLSFISIYIIFSVFFSFDLIQSLLYVLNDAVDFNVVDKRDYVIWLGENVKEFFYAAGLPVMIIFVYMTAHIFSQLKTPKNIANWPLENIFIVSLFINFCVVVFLGINRGEITRLWIYLAVLFQIPAAIFMAKISKGEFAFFLVAGTVTAQAMLTLQRVGFVGP